ncbi:MAG TPA: hypothetical protein VF818_00235 [Ktedonobacterales bacterium]
MARDDHDGDHIWLRQTAQLTLGEQQRTVEIAIPVRVDASADEIERLLEQADAGMDRLTQHLDRRIASLVTGGASLPAETAPASQPQGAAAAPSLAHDASFATPPAPQPDVSAPRPAVAPAPTREPAKPSAASAQEETRETRDTTAPPAPNAAPSRSAEQRASGKELTRADFLAEARALDLNPKQVMERLGVRTLDGLNLREALEMLRRQLVRDMAPSAVAADPDTSARGHTTARTEPPAEPPSPRYDSPPSGLYFDEEDDFDITFAVSGSAMDGSNPAMNGFEAEEFAGDDEESPVDELGLEDVPDFDMPAPAAPAPKSPPAQSRPKRPTASDASLDAIPVDSAPLAGRARAREVVAQLRATPAGGQAAQSQIAAFNNIIAGELGSPAANALVKGIWRTAPATLGAEQLHALIQWGKTDAFAEEAQSVLALLRTERASAEPASDDAAPSQPARPTQPGAPRSTGRSASPRGAR